MGPDADPFDAFMICELEEVAGEPEGLMADAHLFLNALANLRNGSETPPVWSAGIGGRLPDLSVLLVYAIGCGSTR